MIAKFMKEYAGWYLLYLLMGIGFLGMFALYHLPFDFILQSLFFTGSLLAIWTVWLFFRFQRKQVMLEEALYEEILDAFHLPSDLAYLQLLAQEKAVAKQEILAYKSRENEWQALVKMWSHQMKVPLAALSLMSQTNQLNQTDVNHQLLRLDNYMANLLNYMKLSNQASDFRFEKVDVKDVIIALVKKYRRQFLQKEMTVEVVGTWQIKSDRKWLSFALSQVIDNAIKYSPNGGTVTIHLDNGGTISDQGIGILPEDIPRLFEEGFTGYNGREHQKASGFGLYLTKRVLTQLGLMIQITSQIDQGTQVRIWQEK
ncbi:sensor histidine kinase [Streptococcus cuniculi]|uniref:histidine kinase n=1 Tax=Streptococcus cuniculi TaxID=1432788 RepID=A0A4Y9JDJ3_9STRE|nr:sensor histidine kinase [Streptococcus cuniculi]MBF0777567.1 sensor histidine kinase [Streptococcus cuniculi]TFU98611.1 HAMP domain-containing histidine kinase [Streptococcus cuniculi]